MFHPILNQAHAWIERMLRPGDLAVDATVGNGRDTAILAERVGPKGLVIGFDLQQDALDAAAARLTSPGTADRVILVRTGHEGMAGVVAREAPGRRPKAVMFNLGYRPGGDRAFATRAATTIPALESALELTTPGGIVTVVCYPGHAGGQDEQDAVLAWARALPSPRATVVLYQFWNAVRAPCLLAITPK
ncbi:tRNA (mnm(5)s(2)U34)-methyltransferase [Paludisphaera mucosa]|uniref:Class I SAM-dependent methyltransferase n=1 Tax=Paludisphaera mucosa TaxID=3030827 RepID=A0ABT6F409_9BACT|nr:class I SAM-dependent methyltransferase [Paludisphaera mucosa]